MANNNLNGTAVFWFEGGVASSIDNGVGDINLITNNWAGNTNYWYQGAATGFLQGGPGGPGQSLQNYVMLGYRGAKVTGRAYAIIIF